MEESIQRSHKRVDLELRLQSIERQLTKKNKLALVKDLLIPILTVIILFLGYRISADANRLMEVESARAAERDKAAQSQEYMDFFLSNFTHKDKQPAAFAILEFLDPEVRNKLIFSLSSSINLSPDTWQEIVRMNVPLDFGALQGYRVEIYYAFQASRFATEIEQQLKSAEFQGSIYLQQVSEEFWSNYGGKPDTNDIRFEDGVENLPARYLARFIKAKNPDTNIKLQRTNDPDRPGSISVWLPYSARGVP